MLPRSLAPAPSLPCSLAPLLLIPSASRASASGSGLSTMPSPPPKGRSSTVRCLSCVKLRRSCVSIDTRPSFMARRTMPCSKKPAKKPGKMVTMSKRIPLMIEARRQGRSDRGNKGTRELGSESASGPRRNRLTPHPGRTRTGRAGYLAAQPPTSLPAGTAIEPSRTFGMSVSRVGGARLKNTPEHSNSPLRWKSAKVPTDPPV